MDYFERFGKPVDANVVQDSWTSMSRGFGFVTFLDPEAAEEVMRTREHFLDNKFVEVRRLSLNQMQNTSSLLPLMTSSPLRAPVTRSRTRSESSCSSGQTSVETEYSGDNGEAHTVQRRKIFVGGLHFKTNNGN